MRRGTLALALLSLFTSEQRAAEIEGDLIEERAWRGGSWFAIHVVRTALALFGESFKQTPFRITALAGAAAGLSVLACGLMDQTFFAADAPVPAPVLGFLAISASAFLTGFGLGYFASDLGVRAAAATVLVLTVLLAISQIRGYEQLPYGLGPAAMAALKALLSMAWAFAVSVVIFLTPLMAGGAYGRRRA